MEYLWTLMSVYFSAGLAKFILSLPSAPLAVACLHRGIGISYRAAYPITLAGAFIVSMVLWPRLLQQEGWAFFRAYKRIEVIRSVLASIPPPQERPAD